MAEFDFAKAPPKVIINEAIEINVPIGCGDAPVFPGDIMVGDDDSVIVLPAHLAEDIALEARDMTAYEDFVVEQVANGASIIGLYPPTNTKNIETFETWKKDNRP